MNDMKIKQNQSLTLHFCLIFFSGRVLEIGLVMAANIKIEAGILLSEPGHMPLLTFTKCIKFDGYMPDKEKGCTCTFIANNDISVKPM